MHWLMKKDFNNGEVLQFCALAYLLAIVVSAALGAWKVTLTW